MFKKPRYTKQYEKTPIKLHEFDGVFTISEAF